MTYTVRSCARSSSCMALIRQFSRFGFKSAHEEPGLDDDFGDLIETVSAWDACTFTGDSGSSSSSTSRGIPLGSLSGKAIMAVGNFVLRGILAVDVRVRLGRIAHQLGQDRAVLSDAALEDLLELQRRADLVIER